MRWGSRDLDPETMEFIKSRFAQGNAKLAAATGIDLKSLGYY